MNLLVDGRVIQDRFHGIGRYTFELVRALAGSQDRLHVLTADAPQSRLRGQDLAGLPGVQLHPVAGELLSPLSQLRWRSVLDRLQPDAVLAPYHLAAPWSHRGVPTVVMVHDCIFEAMPSLSTDPQDVTDARFRAGYRAATWLALHRASEVATVSVAAARQLRRFYGVAVAPDAVLPHGVGEQFHALGRDRAQASGTGGPRPAGVPAGRYVLHVGVRRPHKNQATLVEAFARLASCAPDLTLVCVGQPDPRFPDRLPGLVRAAGLQGRVQLVGDADEQRLLQLYRYADLFAFPSLIEGFGLPLLEAMAAGVPVVASDAAAVMETSRRAATIVPALDPQRWAQEMAAVLGDPDRSARMVEEGTELAREHTWAGTAAATRALLARVTGPARREVSR